MIQTKGRCGNSNSVVLSYPLPVYISLSQSQRDRINSILSQKEIIQYELGTLMVQPIVTANPNYKDWRHLPQYQRMKIQCKLGFTLGEPCNIKVVDCLLYDNKWQTSGWQTSRLLSWDFRYDDATYDFQFSSQAIYTATTGKILRTTIGTHTNPISLLDISEYESNWDNGIAVTVKKFFAAKLAGGKFNMSEVKLRCNVKIKPSLRIMFGEYDFFEYFAVDDAVLVLEEETISDDFPKLFWTLGIAQNKHVREMMRLASNNPDLFKPLIPK